MIFTEEELPQKSEKWKAFRRDKVGTSEIPIIRGSFPKIWCDDYELFLRKMGKPHDFVNEDMERGNEHEDRARKLVATYLKDCQNGEENSVFCRNVYDRTGGFAVKDPEFKQFTVQYKHFPQIFSSFDGVDIDNKLVLEVKCPTQKVFTKLLKNRKPTVPKMYIDQTQGQLMIAESHWGITEGIFAIYYQDGVYFEDKTTKETHLIRLILIKTELDVEYCKEMETDCKKYCHMISSRKWNTKWKD